jgi:hypothetical protein
MKKIFLPLIITLLSSITANAIELNVNTPTLQDNTSNIVSDELSQEVLDSKDYKYFDGKFSNDARLDHKTLRQYLQDHYYELNKRDQIMMDNLFR